MKALLFSLLLFLLSFAQAQTLPEELKNISTVSQANDFISKNPGAELLRFNSGKDSSSLFEKIQRTGNVVEENGHYYKVVETSSELSFRCSYIFLDGKKLSVKQIDSIRKIILTSYKNGIPFATLATQYSMDNSRYNGGDLGWFAEGIMEEKFESAVKSHKKGEVFTLDIKYNKWYYVILKTYENTEIRIVKVLKVPAGVR